MCGRGDMVFHSRRFAPAAMQEPAHVEESSPAVYSPGRSTGYQISNKRSCENASQVLLSM
jgi:hypothetical protein